MDDSKTIPNCLAVCHKRCQDNSSCLIEATTKTILDCLTENGYGSKTIRFVLSNFPLSYYRVVLLGRQSQIVLPCDGLSFSSLFCLSLWLLCLAHVCIVFSTCICLVFHLSYKYKWLPIYMAFHSSFQVFITLIFKAFVKLSSCSQLAWSLYPQFSVLW